MSALSVSITRESRYVSIATLSDENGVIGTIKFGDVTDAYIRAMAPMLVKRSKKKKKQGEINNE